MANQPEPTSLFNTSVKEYATIVRIDGHTSGLKPGMTAEVEILVADLKNVLSVPVQAVVEQGNNAFYLLVSSTAETSRSGQVNIGAEQQHGRSRSSRGSNEGDEVVLNPRAACRPRRHVHRRARGRGRQVRASQGQDGGQSQLQAGHAAAAKAAPRRRPAAAGRCRQAHGVQPQSGPDISQLDRDGDHKISRDEAPDRMREFFHKIDTNHDGSLDAGGTGGRSGPPRRQRMPALRARSAVDIGRAAAVHGRVTARRPIAEVHFALVLPLSANLPPGRQKPAAAQAALGTGGAGHSDRRHGRDLAGGHGRRRQLPGPAANQGAGRHEHHHPQHQAARGFVAAAEQPVLAVRAVA